MHRRRGANAVLGSQLPVLHPPTDRDRLQRCYRASVSDATSSEAAA
ncbi:MAG: hypothetical protein H6724_11425 [Sandaracinus sp.]|nr:hypothetical protein [Sandaracinus sp.]